MSKTFGSKVGMTPSLKDWSNQGADTGLCRMVHNNGREWLAAPQHSWARIHSSYPGLPGFTQTLELPPLNHLRKRLCAVGELTSPISGNVTHRL